MTMGGVCARPMTLNILNVIAYVANIGFVSLIPTLFHLPDNAQLSVKYQTLVTPAGWAFSIWGIIFVMQALWTVLQIAVPSYRSNPLVVHGVAYNYVFVCAFQVLWSFVFALEYIFVSLFCMVGILYYLIRLYLSVQEVLDEQDDSFRSNHNYWLLRFPFDIHLGWIVAATLVNFSVVLQADVGSAALKFTAAILTLATAVAVACWVLFTEKDQKFPNVVIPMVLVWALNAISKELNNPKDLILNTYSSEEIDVIQNGSFVSALSVLISVIAVVARAIWRNQTITGAEEASLL